MFGIPRMDPAAWAAWAQVGAAIVGVIAAYSIGGAQTRAQREADAKSREEFVKLLRGIARGAASAIGTAADELLDVQTVRTADKFTSTVPHVFAIEALDINRIDNAEVVLALMELRRLCGWTKEHRQEILAAQGNLNQDLVNKIEVWRAKAAAGRDTVLEGLKNEPPVEP